MNDLSLDPARTALLIMDVQQGILARHPDGDAFVAGLVGARAAARAAGLTVGYVRVALTAEEAERIPPTSRFAGSAARLDADGPATQFDERLTADLGEIVVRKQRVGAFSTTDLGARLDQRGIDTLVLTGIATAGVVLSTIRDAADRDYRLVVLEDGCWDSDAEVHRVLTEKVFPRSGATVATIDEFIASLV
ncbi:cysteine hydrolase family protein [Leifsonia sp. 2MCAF36]|uniref:cysteine hydrolase family protein n=1 Tax=Leifsonia sp. 2MCAF36 TaxID=3232988 RepID=UPI003F9C784B